MRGSQAGRGEGEERMTNHLARLYAAAGALIAFFLLWVTIAAHPWAAAAPLTPQDPRLVALAQREKRLQKRAADVKRIVDRRWTIYERRSARREWQNSVALQRHLQQLEASQATAVRAARAATEQTAQARAYAASVVAWANQQLGITAASTVAATPAAAVATNAVAPVRSSKLPAPATSKAPAAAAASPTHAAPSTVAAPSPTPTPAVAPAAPAAAKAAAPAPAPVKAAPAPAPAPAPVAAAPPPVQVVALPPVTTTKVSKK